MVGGPGHWEDEPDAGQSEKRACGLGSLSVCGEGNYELRIEEPPLAEGILRRIPAYPIS